MTSATTWPPSTSRSATSSGRTPGTTTPSSATPRRGIYVDATRVHDINHHGRYFRVPGFAQWEPSPQRSPVIFQAGGSSKGPRPGRGERRRGVRQRGVEGGPEASGRRAREHWQRSTAGTPGTSRCSRCSTSWSRRPTSSPTRSTSPTAVWSATPGRWPATADGRAWTCRSSTRMCPCATSRRKDGQTMIDIFSKMDPDKEWTPRDIAEFIGIGGAGPTIVGSPSTVADELIAMEGRDRHHRLQPRQRPEVPGHGRLHRARRPRAAAPGRRADLVRGLDPARDALRGRHLPSEPRPPRRPRPARPRSGRGQPSRTARACYGAQAEPSVSPAPGRGTRRGVRNARWWSGVASAAWRRRSRCGGRDGTSRSASGGRGRGTRARASRSGRTRCGRSTPWGWATTSGPSGTRTRPAGSGTGAGGGSRAPTTPRSPAGTATASSCSIAPTCCACSRTPCPPGSSGPACPWTPPMRDPGTSSSVPTGSPRRPARSSTPPHGPARRAPSPGV